MPNTSQGKNAVRKKISSWDDAIADVQERIKDLEFSLKVFKDRKKKGEPWPGTEGYTLTQKAGTAKEAIPA
jgi:hypothetical protein